VTCRRVTTPFSSAFSAFSAVRGIERAFQYAFSSRKYWKTPGKSPVFGFKREGGYGFSCKELQRKNEHFSFTKSPKNAQIGLARSPSPFSAPSAVTPHSGLFHHQRIPAHLPLPQCLMRDFTPSKRPEKGRIFGPLLFFYAHNPSRSAVSASSAVIPPCVSICIHLRLIFRSHCSAQHFQPIPLCALCVFARGDPGRPLCALSALRGSSSIFSQPRWDSFVLKSPQNPNFSGRPLFFLQWSPPLSALSAPSAVNPFRRPHGSRAGQEVLPQPKACAILAAGEDNHSSAALPRTTQQDRRDRLAKRGRSAVPTRPLESQR